jgi:class 3 adenylate cyclase/tetratricopeptide (TPR) repeat protein
MAEQRRERKVVTVLFADLVGFTARSEALDPEDVEAILHPYHERLRAELERFGGTVEKFIGDAVMALFGAPVAHEDDPERAVRAALAIRDWAREDETVQVRIAVNTGEALIKLGARPETGEGMAAGDVVNTTARMQSAAPVNGVLVGEQTYRATSEAITFRAADPVDAKGKAEPVPAWEAVEPRSRVGSEAVSVQAPLVGRRRELDQLIDAFERARQDRSTQLVTLVGVPGIGKSRLVAELFAHVESLPDPVFWRHGRSLPYGDGVTFWALGEMVKAHAGIVENDPPEVAERKLHEIVSDLVGESERRWLESQLKPLIGLGETDAAGERGEPLAAWRRLFEALADRHPLVLVFEDLHWAGDELLDFVDELPDWIEDVPLLVLCTARPELLDRRSGWGGGKRNALTISLSALAAAETAALVASLLDRVVLPADVQSELLARAGGNPLYAEQFVRMLTERGDVGGEVPENVQGIIAARLDSLPLEEKGLLQDAAVVGKVFWTSALTALGGAPVEDLERHLRSLARKEFVRRERRVAVEGESEYVFTHILLRDVAYGQIPRSDRADKHRRTAEWIESVGRAEDQAELLAHHYASALDLSRLSGGESDELAVRTRHALRAAGVRALALNAYAAAVRWFEAADSIGIQPDPDRPRALLHHGLALRDLLAPGRFELLDDARTSLLAAGDSDGAAEADVALAEAWWWSGERDRCAASLARAEELVRDSGTSIARAVVLSQVARFRGLFGEHEEGVEPALESLRLGEQLGRDDLRAKNLVTLGTARFFLPDADRDAAFGEVRQGIELAQACGDVSQLSRGFVNLSALSFNAGELGEAEEATREVHRLAVLRGHEAAIRFSESNLIDGAFVVGKWAEAARLAEAFVEASKAQGHYGDTIALSALAVFALARDEPDTAAAHTEAALEIARRIKDPQALLPALAAAAMVYAELGEADRARIVHSELEPGPYIASIPLAFFSAVELGIVDAWRERIASFRRDTPWDVAADAVLDVRWADAAAAYADMGARPFAALSSLRAADVHARAGRRAAADEELARALAFFRSVGANRYVREGERLLAATA